MEELKVPTASWDTMTSTGHGLIAGVHSALVDPVWAAIALAVPAGIPVAPRASVSFLLPAGEHYFDINGRTMNGARAQGDADQELVYLPDAAAAPLDDEALQRAAERVGLARFALAHPVIGAALRQFLSCGDVTLAAVERMLLAVTAAEQLLLPDTTVASGETFARRLGHLLGQDEPHREEVRGVAAQLYRIRNATLHAEDRDAGHGAAMPPAAAEQLLAGAIEGASIAIHRGTGIEQFRQDLDQPPSAAAPATRRLVAEPAGLAPPDRLQPARPWQSATTSTGESLASEDGTIASWSPLVGLRYQGPAVGHDGLGVRMATMSADAAVGMEEKDIRRDFIARLRLDEPLAAIAVVAPHDGAMVTPAQVAPLTRARDLAVAGLRLAGHGGFINPALLGWYVYDGNLRYRRETVLRQSILMRLQSVDSDPIDAAAIGAVGGTWTLLARYEREARDPGIDRILDLYRRVHDRRFLPNTTRGHLMWMGLEQVLGRFRPATATLGLGNLVELLQRGAGRERRVVPNERPGVSQRARPRRVEPRAAGPAGGLARRPRAPDAHARDSAGRGADAADHVGRRRSARAQAAWPVAPAGAAPQQEKEERIATRGPRSDRH